MNLKPAQYIIETFEGFRSKPYLCPAGIPTIGFGSTHYPSGESVTLSDPPITIEYAREITLYEMNLCHKALMRLCPNVKDEGIINALVSFIYNLGAGRLQVSTLRKRVIANDTKGIKTELRKWVKGGGKTLRGLVLRREAECLLIKD